METPKFILFDQIYFFMSLNGNNVTDLFKKNLNFKYLLEFYKNNRFLPNAFADEVFLKELK